MNQTFSYWKDFSTTVYSLLRGLRITFSHLAKINTRRNRQKRLNIQSPDYFQHQGGIATVSYPHESLGIPINGRYKLHNEIDDCIVCDKCVKVCPVNCITIDPIRSPDEFGKTSDGSSKKIYAAKFDIDMAKCCFCGLCTVVCPTECLTMTPVFDFSTFHIEDHYFRFSSMSEEEIIHRKKEWEDYLAAKSKSEGTTNPAIQKPALRPKLTPGTPPHET